MIFYIISVYIKYKYKNTIKFLYTMRKIFFFMALSLSLFYSSCTKEDITVDIKEYYLSGDMKVSHYNYDSEPLVYIKVDDEHQLFYINNNTLETYRRSDKYDSRYYLRWELTDSVAYIYRYMPNENTHDWSRVNVYSIYYTDAISIEEVKSIFDINDILY